MSQRRRDSPAEPVVDDRWWVDVSGVRSRREDRSSETTAGRFFHTVRDFNQDGAVRRLTENNLTLLSEAQPPEGGWAYVKLVEPPRSKRERERLQRLVALPDYARGVFVDSGGLTRLVITGTPIGARILELALSSTVSFDAWVDGEWVEELLFEDAEKALRALRRSVEHYLSPAQIEHWNAVRARA